MRRLALLLALACMLPWTGAAAPPPAASRVIVSNTLNGTLAFFDAQALTESQPPLPVRGTSPVRLWVQRFGTRTYLLSANHGIEGSIGIYDLDAPLATEMPASPFPTGPGSVGIAAGEMRAGTATVPMIFATNTTFALGGCGMPTGSVTAYTARDIATTGLIPAGRVELSGPIPYAVAVDPARGAAYVSSNCANTLDTIAVARQETLGIEQVSIARAATRPTPAGPDAVIYDPVHDLVFVTNITASSVSVFDASSPAALTTVPMPGARPIDANLADSRSGAHWLVTSNGGNDTIGVIDRDVAAACAANGVPVCPQAYALQVATGVAGGAPEGIDYDPATNRVFTVNKNIGNPSLSVIQLREEGGLSGAPVARLPLGAAGAATPIPAFIAFDVVVQTRS